MFSKIHKLSTWWNLIPISMKLTSLYDEESFSKQNLLFYVSYEMSPYNLLKCLKNVMRELNNLLILCFIFSCSSASMIWISLYNLWNRGWMVLIRLCFWILIFHARRTHLFSSTLCDSNCSQSVQHVFQAFGCQLVLLKCYAMLFTA